MPSVSTVPWSGPSVCPRRAEGSDGGQCLMLGCIFK